MSSMKKLKRGLEDLSPLFQEEEPAAAAGENRPVPHGADIEIAADVVLLFGEGSVLPLGYEMIRRFPFDEKESMLLTLGHESLSGQAAAVQAPCVARGGAYSRWMNWRDFEGVFDKPLETRSSRQTFPRVLFVDAALTACPQPSQLLRMADKAVFWLSGSFDSLGYAYKTMKAACSFNPDLECYLVYRGGEKDPEAALIFEKFSEMASRFLSVNLFWLGAWEETPQGEGCGHLKTEIFWMQAGGAKMTSEKIQFFEFLRKPQGNDA